MPIEDASTVGPEVDIPYPAAAPIAATPQNTWGDGIRAFNADHLAFNPWTGLPPRLPTTVPTVRSAIGTLEDQTGGSRSSEEGRETPSINRYHRAGSIVRWE